jgi:Flavodoxin
MERALVIFESMFGNTRTIAEAVADGLSSGFATELTEVSLAPTTIPEDVSLLVVGGPTHAFGLTRPRTREDAATQTDGPLVSPVGGIREWLEMVEAPPSGHAAAAFDTRIAKPRLPGSAARGAEKRLRRLGFRVVAAAESFYVTGTKGPLVPGEVERARRWAEQMAVQGRASSSLANGATWR